MFYNSGCIGWCVLYNFCILFSVFRDSLLLEAGFLAFLVAPCVLLRRSPAPHDSVTFWLTRWLLFRLVLCTGVSKLASGDPCWWDLTGMYLHSGKKNFFSFFPFCWDLIFCWILSSSSTLLIAFCSTESVLWHPSEPHPLGLVHPSASWLAVEAWCSVHVGGGDCRSTPDVLHSCSWVKNQRFFHHGRT